MYAAGQWRLASYSFTNGNKMSKMARTLLGLIFAVLINHFLFAEGFDVRLINNLDNCFGRVEVQHNNTWGTVCGESWDISDAAVVCRQLNCGRALTAHAWALFGEGSGPIWSPVNCAGTESSVEDCIPHTGFGPNDCSHNQDAGVVCSASVVVIVGSVIIAVVFLLSITIIIILVVRSKRRSQKQQISSSDCIQDVVTMHDVPHEDRYEESDDDDDYEKVDVDGDREDLNSNFEEDYVNMDEPVQTNVRSDNSEQDVNVETEDSEGDYVNVESEDSEQDYVNVDITEH
ncbi:antigen WC1.1 [Triplophysa rosa]|uniref:antigen WC1.1 n=1 Tax=Triplophysa rosa TaxID=992332 RepID=UPI002545C00B|nr:antigen WC1.1 [Triplophysa rosa]